ncbi:DUF4129 domain-containing protein [Halopiger xanaduensis]|uniref:Protein-glutamine gamma-glutamyltransferase-like C-terminal domain-containing protein n=1 Tax=Halopiger xanaduensis (strain DSM 18323 / JCM 14033 / SH-6) TaxID=797210 RepID=F8D7L9_HALXS|nr:DUF4129 domain-containing protein [Halopiger xanaduensis]AEH36518.1 hypothetical protein Halxa_1891 [Halopiger xanaduensis SH-6]
MSASGTRQLLVVLGCVVCLLAVASALPAADPRLDPPGTTGDSSNGSPSAGEWEAITGDDPFADPAVERDDDDGPGSDDPVGAPEPTIEIDGALEPGNEVTISIDSASTFNEQTVEVNGDDVGETGWGSVDATVPYAEEMTVRVAETNASRTVDVETNATIRTHDGAVPAGDMEVSAVVGSTPVPDATVFVDGVSAAETDEDGRATVTLPDEAGPTDLRVEREPVTGERAVEVTEPQVEFVSPLLFPGSPAPVQVSADGTPIPNATVSLESGGTATTGDDGRTRLWLPIADEATVTTSVGDETATATVGDLYLRLAAIVVLGPGFAIGAVVTYFRVAARTDRRGSGLSGFVVGLGDVLSGVAAALSGAIDGAARAVSRLAGLFTVQGPRLPSLSRLRLSLPSPSFGGGLGFPSLSTSLGSALSSFGRAFGSLSIGSLFGSSRNRGSRLGRPSLGDWLGGDDDDGDGDVDDADADDGGPPPLADEPLGPRGPRAEIRAAWHAFLDRLEVTRRETLTPGQVARRALQSGFPATLVARLVAIVRDVEYGRREPSPERVLEAREAARALISADDADDADADDGNEEVGSR